MTQNSDFNSNFKVYDQVLASEKPVLFENLPELIELRLASLFLNKSVKTLYDWNYRGETRKSKIPPDLFIKIGGSLRIRKDVLRKWMSPRCSL